MPDLTSWSNLDDEASGIHHVQHLTANESDVPRGVEWAADLLPSQYADPDRVAALLVKLGKPKAARYVSNKLPAGTRARSADLGEILGSSFATDILAFGGVHRLRWKDHREMAMRGEDVIGIRPSAALKVEYLKGEVKSRALLTAAVVGSADVALRKDRGRPSPHALEFIADRLHETGDDTLADLVDESLLVAGISASQVTHMLFTFSGNDPRTMLRNNVAAYRGKIKQFAVGLQITAHQLFISNVYERVIANLGHH